MSLISLLWMISAVILTAIVIVYGYLKLYQVKVDQAMEDGKPMKNPMTPPYKVANAAKTILVIAVLMPVVPYFAANRPTSAKALEQSVQQRAADDNRNVVLVQTESTAAALYYTEDQSDHSFALYENRGRFMDDYCFIHGGSSTSIEESVRAFRMEDTGELVLFSMNRLHIARIDCYDGSTYHLDPDSPFVLVLPGSGADLYDVEENLVDLEKNQWFEITVKD